jgi:hypothetical protein
MTDARTQPAPAPRSPLDSLSLVISGFGGGASFRTVLLDWIEFLGGRPAEILYIDGGSPPSTHRALTRLLNEGLIDRLELLSPRHWENSFDRCYIQEYRSGALAQQPYILFIKPDMLPFRRGHDDWLAQDIRRLDDPATLAITTTHLIDPPAAREGPYLAYDFASLNFTLMRRDRFHAAMQEQIGELIASNFRAPYPEHLQPDPRWRRALIEWAWQAHCRRHNLRTLARAESPDWTIYHINKSGRKLLEYRRRYRARDGIEAFFDKSKALYRPPLRPWQQWGRSLEGAIRSVKRSAPRAGA